MSSEQRRRNNIVPDNVAKTMQQHCSMTISLNPLSTLLKVKFRILRWLAAPCARPRRPSGPADKYVRTRYASATALKAPAPTQTIRPAWEGQWCHADTLAT